ncbi:MAG: choice-of-anchor P family protein [Candidatus Sulfotelmatobacter sp.]
MASTPSTNRVHYYHADACAYGGFFQSPVNQIIAPQASLSLGMSGGYGSAAAESFQLEGAPNLLSYDSASTQVSGQLQNEGWVTLVTATLENLNVMGMVMADSLSAQILTVHPLEGDNPTVSFAGAAITGLSVGGIPVQVTLDPNICAQTNMNSDGFPAESCVTDEGFLERVAAQYQSMIDVPGVPGWITERYNPENLQDGECGSVLCSLVSGVEPASPSSGVSGGSSPFTAYGNVLVVPGFGNVFLGELLVDCKSYRLGMLRLEIQGRGSGQQGGPIACANGITEPPGG